MIRCDTVHEHDTLDAALACVRVTKVERGGPTLPEAGSPESAALASTSGARKGRPRRHPDNPTRHRAYRERMRCNQYSATEAQPHATAMTPMAQPTTTVPKATYASGLPGR